MSLSQVTDYITDLEKRGLQLKEAIRVMELEAKVTLGYPDIDAAKLGLTSYADGSNRRMMRTAAQAMLDALEMIEGPSSRASEDMRQQREVLRRAALGLPANAMDDYIFSVNESLGKAYVALCTEHSQVLKMLKIARVVKANKEVVFTTLEQEPSNRRVMR